MFVIVGRRRHVVAAAAAFVLAAALLVTAATAEPAQSAALTVTDWGLHFQQDGQPPTGNASAAELSRYNAAFLGDTTRKVIYLTFDAGYENGYTPAILDALKKHQVCATFFVVGNYLETAPELVRRMVEEGHLVGNHTYHHPDMSRIASREDFTKELTELETKYKTVTGQDMAKLYRPPQGKFSEQNLQYARDMGYHTCFWSLAYVDWYTDQQPTHEDALRKLTTRIHNGAVVLLHSTSQTNAEILDELLTAWETQGYTFGKLTDLWPTVPDTTATSPTTV